MKQIAKFLIAIIIAVVPVFGHAETVTLILKNGTTLVGELVSLDPTSVVEINVAGLNTKISFSDIEKIEQKEVAATAPVNNETTRCIPKEKVINISGVDVKFVLVEGGTFSYGFDGPGSKRNDSEPVHDITISSFYVSEYPVKRSLFKAVMNVDPWEGYELVKGGNTGSDYVVSCTPQEEINDQNKDVAFISLAKNKNDIFGYDWGTFVPEIPTAKEFIDKLNYVVNLNADILTEAQWAYLHKTNNRDIHFPFNPEIVTSISMNESKDPRGGRVMLKGLEGKPYLSLYGKYLSMYDNRISDPIFKFDKKKKKIILGALKDLIAPMHIVLPAK